MNHEKRWVIFGAWDVRETPDMQAILMDDWEIRRGRRTPAYKESLEYLGLVHQGYSLFTFRMERELAYPGTGLETSKIKKFSSNVEHKILRRIEGGWGAFDAPISNASSDLNELDEVEYPEGGKKRVFVNSYERNPKARAICLLHHGFICKVCDVRLEDKYGPIARDFIHVHHKIKISKKGGEYKVNPKEDLVPVCPNCHAIIHLIEPMLSVEQARSFLETKKDSAAP